jgi:hypothetical protein
MGYKMKNPGNSDFARKVIELDESMREISALDTLYDELVTSAPDTKRETESKKDEARFARERILKLSLHAKNLLASIESHETLK